MTNSAITATKSEYRLFIGAAVLFALVSIYATRVADPDMWGHLLYGKHFSENGLVHEDPFAYTSTGQHWSSHEYLSQIVFWQSYNLGGSLGLILLKCLIGGAAILCLYGAVRAGCDDPRLWAPVLILSAGIVARSFLFRPQLFTFLFFSWFVMVLLRHLLGRSSKWWLLSLPVVLALWVNMHGGFLAGVGAIGLALFLRCVQSIYQNGLNPGKLFGHAWPLAVTLAVCVLASFLNPLGWHMWGYLVTELGNETNKLLIEEWQPPQLHVHTWSVLTLWLLVGTVAFAGVIAQLRTRSPGADATRLAAIPAWVWPLSCVPLTIMAFQTVRHIPILAIWAAPVLAMLAQTASSAAGRRAWRGVGARLDWIWRRGWLAFTGLVMLPALLTVWIVGQDPLPRISTASSSTLGEKTPYGVTAFMRRNDIRGNVYNPLWWGSYLSWELYPNVRVSMDGRNVTLFSDKMVEDNLRYYAGEKQIDVFEQYPETDFLLLPADCLDLANLREDKRWLKIFEDPNAVLFVRADEAHKDTMQRIRNGQTAVTAARRLTVFE